MVEQPTLRAFREELLKRLPSPHARPFVCDGSPLACRSFIVGLNAATRLEQPFTSYWSDEAGFLLGQFQHDYNATRSRKGNRPVIEAISASIHPCLETNLYAHPTKKARDLTPEDRKAPIIEFLFLTVRPRLVFAHSNEPIRFFEQATGCSGFTSEVKQVKWHGHEFLLFGRSGPLYTLGPKGGATLGEQLGRRLSNGEAAS